MKNILRKALVLAVFVVGPLAQAQVITGVPRQAVGSASFDRFELQEGLFKDANDKTLYGDFKSEDGITIGSISCLDSNGLFYFTGIVKVGHTKKMGNFQFASQQKCVQVVRTLVENPEARVTFKVILKTPQAGYDGKIIGVAF